MQTHDILRLVWSKIERPHSMCPDVEIGHVRLVLGEAMAAEIKDRGVLTGEIDCWVLGQLIIGPTDGPYLAGEWYETNHVYVEGPKPPNDDYEDEDYQKASDAHYAAIEQEETQRATEVAETLRDLIEKGLVGKTSESGYEKYFADPTAYLEPRCPDRC